MSKITELAALTTGIANSDVLPIVDVSDHTMDTTGTTKKITIANLLGSSATSTVFNVADPPFGAAGDGVNDDHDAILAACNAAKAANGAVYFPATTNWYRVGQPVAVAGGSALTLYGDGYRSVIKANGNFDIFQLSNLGGLTIQSLRFDTEVTPVSGAALNLDSCANMYFIWVQTNNVWNGLYTTGSNTITMFGSFFHGLNTGMYTQNAVHAVASQFGGGTYGADLDSLSGSASFVSCAFFGPLSLVTHNSLGRTHPNKGLTFINSGSNFETGRGAPPEGNGGFNLDNCGGNVILEQCWNAGAGLTFGGNTALDTLHIVGGEYGGSGSAQASSILMKNGVNITVSGAKIGGTKNSSTDSVVIGTSRTDTGCTTQTGASATTVLDPNAAQTDLNSLISGTGIPAGATITAVNTTVLPHGYTISAGATVANSGGAALTITQNVDNVIVTGNQFIGTCRYCVAAAVPGSGDGEIIISENDFTGVTPNADNPVSFPSGSAASYNIHDNTGGLTTASSTDWINVVTQYGADPSGSTNSTTVIQAAITAAQATGRTVYFPAGTYKISSALNVGGGSPGAITICGDGWDSQIILASGSNAYIFDLGASNAPQYTPGLTIRDLYLNCNGANQSSAGGGIFARGAVWCVFDHLWVEAPWGEGIYFYQDGTSSYGHHNTVRDCLFRNGKNSNTGGGLALKVRNADENLFLGCTIQDCGNVSATQNGQVYDTAAGLSTYTGCHFVGGAAGAPFVKSDSSPGRLVFTGCQFDGTNSADMLVLQGSGHVVSGCQFLNVGQGLTSGQAAGVRLDGAGATGCSVSDCNFGGLNAHALAIWEATGATGNYIGLNAYTGTWLGSAPVSLTTGGASAVATSSTGLSPGGSSSYLRADGQWAAPAGGSGGGGDTLYAYGNTGATPSLTLATGNVVTATLTSGTSAVAFTFGTAPATVFSFTLILNSGAGGIAVTWPSGTRWQDAIPPALSQTANFTDILVFTTTNTGTNWYGSLAGVHFA